MERGIEELSQSLARAAERAGEYTVMVEGRKEGPASGVAWREDLVLTASHAVDREEGIAVVLPGGEAARARLAGRDTARDLALLRVEGIPPFPSVPEAGAPRVGQLALSVARTAREGVNATLGIVSAVGANLSLWKGGLIESYLRTDGPRRPGFSGGPVADVSGALLGINVFGPRYGTSIAIPAALAFRTAEHLRSNGSVRRGYLGVRSQAVELPAGARASLGGRQGAGLLVVGVERGSPAEEAGLMVGDILVGFGGTSVAGHEELIAFLGSPAVERRVRIEILRGGSLAGLDVTVGWTL
jgi:serine protease Do